MTFQEWHQQFPVAYRPVNNVWYAREAWEAAAREARRQAFEEAIEVVRTLRAPEGSAIYADEDGRIADALRKAVETQ